MPDEDLDAFLRRTGRTPYSEAKDAPTPGTTDEYSPDPSRSNVFTGILQAGLGIPEFFLEGGRKIASRYDPDVMTADTPLNRLITEGQHLRKDVESTTPGMVGEIGGSMLTGAGEEYALARFLGAAPKTLRALAARMALGGASGATSQPSDDLNELATRAGTGVIGAGFQGKAAMTAAKEAKKLSNAKTASRLASGIEGEAKAAMEAVKRKDPMRASLMEDYYKAREAARIKRAEIPGNVPEGFWPFLHNLPHYTRMNLARWLMRLTPPRAEATVTGAAVNKYENPQ